VHVIPIPHDRARGGGVKIVTTTRLASKIPKMRLSVIGQGYVGLSIAMAAARAGHEVVGIDISSDLIGNLKSGKSHIEDIPDTVLQDLISSGKYLPTDDFALAKGCEVAVIAVPTPLDSAEKPDLGMLINATERLSEVLDERTLVINESTSYPGTLRHVIGPILSAAGKPKHLLAVSPERVDPGNRNFGTRNTPRIVGALDEEARRAATEFYLSFCDFVLPVSSAEVAEAAKLLENSFRFVNIGFINEFSKIMEDLGISISEVIEAASSKPYGFMKFVPSVGIGGHCIPVDPIYLQHLASSIGKESAFLSIAKETNDSMPFYVAQILEKRFGSLKGKKILLLGVAYKANISDTRETAAEGFRRALAQSGAIVSWHDPWVEKWQGEDPADISGDYDLGFVVAQHDNFDLQKWGGAPVYCLTSNQNHPEWIAILDDFSV